MDPIANIVKTKYLVPAHGTSIVADYLIVNNLSIINSLTVNNVVATGGTSTLSNLDITGAASFGNIVVNGTNAILTTNLSSVSTISNLNITGNLTVTGVTSFNNIVILGTPTLPALVVTGSITSNNIVATGATSTMSNLNVTGAASFGNIVISGSSAISTTNTSSVSTISNLDITGTMVVTGAASMGSVTATGTSTIGALVVTNTLTANNVVATTASIGGVTFASLVNAPKLVNRILVGPSGTFTTLKAAVDWYNTNATANVEILIDSGYFDVTSTIIINNPTYILTIRGAGYTTILRAATGLTNMPMFDVRSTCYFNKMAIVGSSLVGYGTLNTEDCFLFNVVPNIYVEIVDFTLDGFYRATNDKIGVSIFNFNFIIRNCNTCCEVNYTTSNTAVQNIDFEVGNFSNYRVGLALTKTGQRHGLRLYNLLFLNTNATDIGINYVPADFIYDYIFSNLVGCTYNFIGIFINGIDFTLQRDADIQIYICTGTDDAKPQALLDVSNNSTVTTTGLAGVYVKAVFVNGPTSYSRKLGLTDNKITYWPRGSCNLACNISGNLSVTNPNRTITVNLRKNIFVATVTNNGNIITVTTSTNHNMRSGAKIQMLGWTGDTVVWNGYYAITVINLTTFTYTSTGTGIHTATGGTCGALFSEITIRTPAANTMTPYALMSIVEKMSINDYIELYVSSNNNTESITFSDVNWVCLGQ